ncbi:hypothetical protein LTR08_008877 [Meristemomyces frigidus]|nr:hypothetical protein LTR08_008877 [Meristemomyces frigidus]
MSFKKVFERRVNENMQENKAGRAPPPEVADPDVDMKKQYPPSSPEPQGLAEDLEWSEKTDRPPRFSTLFDVAPPLPPRAFDGYPERKRKSGVFLPTPLFFIFAIILVFESTLLFAYTVIGLYNNLPSRLVPVGAGCACELMDRQPAVNIAPNFVMPQAQAQAPITNTVTVFGGGALPDLLPTATFTTSAIVTSISTSTSTSATSSIDATSHAAAVLASDVLGMLNTLTTSTSTTPTSSGSSLIIVTASPPASTLILSEVPPLPSTVQSTLLLTVNAAGSTLAPRPTVTLTSAIDAAEASANGAVSSLAAASSVQAALASLSAALTPDPILTLLTSATSVPSIVATTAAPSSVSLSSS